MHTVRVSPPPVAAPSEVQLVEKGHKNETFALR